MSDQTTETASDKAQTASDTLDTITSTSRVINGAEAMAAGPGIILSATWMVHQFMVIEHDGMYARIVNIVESSAPSTDMTVRLATLYPDQAYTVISEATDATRTLAAVLAAQYRQSDQTNRNIRAKTQELEDFKNTVRDVALEKAKQHDWCDVVVDALEEMGISATTDHTVTVYIDVNMSLRVGTDTDDIEYDEIRDAISNGDYNIDRVSDISQN